LSARFQKDETKTADEDQGDSQQHGSVRRSGHEFDPLAALRFPKYARPGFRTAMR